MPEPAPSRDASADAPSAPEVPRGLVLFAPTASPAHRRRRLLFLALAVTAACAVIWPIYPLATSARPFVLGLPFSLAWLIGWLLLIFVGLVGLYRHDRRRSA
jgi:hypothetical protein